jgi:hypothetical protein
MPIVIAESYEHYVRRLVGDLDIKLLGDGVYASVFKHPTDPNIAVKVYRKDIGYERYIDWCLKNKRNKYVPKLKGKAKVFKDKSNNYIGVVFLEKLVSVSQASYRKFCTYISDSLARSAGYVPQYPIDEYDKEDWELVAGYMPDKDLSDLARFLVSNWEHLDVSISNLMLRGNQVVFTDPLG